jgi:hypothetical protein
MKLLVFSDSHSQTGAMLSAIERGQPDMIVHLGDHVYDTAAIRARFPAIPLHCVRGNCDPGRDGGAETGTLELCGMKILLTHGHLYGVKNGLDRIMQTGVSSGADLVLFGHTHKAAIMRSGNTTLFNPGAVSGRGWDKDRTYGVVILDGRTPRCTVERI